MTERRFLLAVLALACLAIYLFVSAPPPLPEAAPRQATLPVAELFTVLETANDGVRTLWTEDIVEAGSRAGLAFDEYWRDEGLDAGPLPALFFREIAASLERHPVRLGLYLGSDYPISRSNAFEGLSLERFRALRENDEAQFFFVADVGLHTGMFSDIATTQACVDCHNDHAQSPKTDWQLGDVMGASTWTYPDAKLTPGEFIAVVTALHQAFADAYDAYLGKVATFADPPPLGTRWPRDGYFLPDRATFMAEAYRRTAPATLAAITALTGPADGARRAGGVPDGSPTAGAPAAGPRPLPAARDATAGPEPRDADAGR